MAIYDYLTGHLDAGNLPTAPVLWRLARACHHVAATEPDKKQKEALVRQVWCASPSSCRHAATSPYYHAAMSSLR